MRKTPGFSHSGRLWDVSNAPGRNRIRSIRIFFIVQVFIISGSLKGCPKGRIIIKLSVFPLKGQFFRTRL